MSSTDEGDLIYLLLSLLRWTSFKKSDPSSFLSLLFSLFFSLDAEMIEIDPNHVTGRWVLTSSEALIHFVPSQLISTIESISLTDLFFVANAMLRDKLSRPPSVSPGGLGAVRLKMSPCGERL